MLHGDLPRPGYPAALRASAPGRWWNDAQATLGYARAAHARRGHLADTAGAIATAACEAAHAVLAARGQWVTNEKNLLERAGLRGVDTLLAGLTAEPGRLRTAVDAAEAMLRAATGEHGDPRAHDEGRGRCSRRSNCRRDPSASFGRPGGGRGRGGADQGRARAGQPSGGAGPVDRVEPATRPPAAPCGGLAPWCSGRRVATSQRRRVHPGYARLLPPHRQRHRRCRRLARQGRVRRLDALPRPRRPVADRASAHRRALPRQRGRPRPQIDIQLFLGEQLVSDSPCRSSARRGANSLACRPPVRRRDPGVQRVIPRITFERVRRIQRAVVLKIILVRAGGQVVVLVGHVSCSPLLGCLGGPAIDRRRVRPG